MTQAFRIFIKSICLVLLLFGQAIASGSATSFGPKESVSLKDFLPHLMDAEGYYEEWSHGVWMEDGSFIGIDFYISNLGIGDHKGAVKMEYKDPHGQRTKCNKKYDSDDWSYLPNKFELQFGENRLSGDFKELNIIAKCKKMSLELNFQNQADPFMPGTGKLHFGKQDGVYSKVFTSPRARVAGHIVQGGKKSSVKGVGYGDHSYSSTYPHKYVRRWFRFQSVKEDYSIHIAEMEATTKYANVGNGWVIISNSEGKIVATAQARFQYAGFIEDSRSDEGYRIPRLVNLTAIDGGTTVSGRFVMQGINKIRDPLSDLDGFSKVIVRRFTKPKDYHIDCRYRLKIAVSEKPQDEIIQGEGTYRFVFANP